MAPPALFFLAALTIRQDQTPLRSGCDAEAETVASLPAGTPVEIRFRLADGSDCFKIAATGNGKAIAGYVASTALAGVDRFEQDRSSAASVDVIQALSPVAAETKKSVVVTGDPALVRAAELIESNHPVQALEILDPALRRYPNNPSVLMLAGLASYRADQLRAALDYWKQSLDLAPNETLSRVYDKVRREAENARSRDKLYGLRVALRYEGQSFPAEASR